MEGVYFENSIEEFYPHKTISASIKLLSYLFINTVPHQSIQCLWNSNKTPLRPALSLALWLLCSFNLVATRVRPRLTIYFLTQSSFSSFYLSRYLLVSSIHFSPQLAAGTVYYFIAVYSLSPYTCRHAYFFLSLLHPASNLDFFSPHIAYLQLPIIMRYVTLGKKNASCTIRIPFNSIHT
jgi:hypothetical protein